MKRNPDRTLWFGFLNFGGDLGKTTNDVIFRVAESIANLQCSEYQFKRNTKTEGIRRNGCVGGRDGGRASASEESLIWVLRLRVPRC